jgi:deazaflavin-dependent oxidoreductase (nitroreductase family)
MALADEAYAYVTTTGRKSGLPREIEIWFALHGESIYLLSGTGHGAHWVRNLRQDPRIAVRIADRSFTGRARFVADPLEDARARELVGRKYEEGEDSEWLGTALVVAIDLSDT